MLGLQWDKDLALKARFDDGYDSGSRKRTTKLVKNMYAKGLSPALIAQIAETSVENVLNMARNNIVSQ